MNRRCSGCSKNGHNSRTCPYYSSSASRTTVTTVKLFGVRLSMTHGSGSCSAASPNHNSPFSHYSSDGYVLDSEPSTPAATINCHHPPPSINKGIPWSQEEHRLFLIGLEKLGKGDWRGISRNYVVSRTPTQVASHAQKYFIRLRQSNATPRKRRSSLFDMFKNLASNSPSLKEEQVLLQPSKNSQLSNVEEELNETIMVSNEATPASPLPGFFRPPYPALPFSSWPSSACSFGEATLILDGRPLH
ncbi:hypothetical protein HN51_027000 [Arachis hypogaea]|uniref:Transcription factor MYBS3 n=1 Tax=Arachis duranensis TaxID=130453 RepID=A0A6P4C426_ARADU|nr:transcription factor MYBS3 [Arachis duranensis]XP_025617774.1 transcription factor MYBS3 [Arachis hypogaea]QHO33259.1 Myb-like protein J [Arachis hypogaea]